MMRFRFVQLVLSASIVLPCAAFCLPADKEKALPATPATVVDVGSFGIIVNGKRVATESFRLEQVNKMNRITAELKFDSAKATQNSDMEVTSLGQLKKYTWREVQPSKSQITVEPEDDQFMVLHFSDGSGGAPRNASHALSSLTSILDDNFFSQMEVLAWKYMAMGCRMNAAQQNECNWTTQKLPVLNPHQEQATLVTMQYLGREKMQFGGAAHDYNAFVLQGETGDWKLWFNDENKLIRVLIAGENTEVLRD